MLEPRLTSVIKSVEDGEILLTPWEFEHIADLSRFYGHVQRKCHSEIEARSSLPGHKIPLVVPKLTWIFTLRIQCLAQVRQPPSQLRLLLTCPFSDIAMLSSIVISAMLLVGSGGLSTTWTAWKTRRYSLRIRQTNH